MLISASAVIFRTLVGNIKGDMQQVENCTRKYDCDVTFGHSVFMRNATLHSTSVLVQWLLLLSRIYSVIFQIGRKLYHGISHVSLSEHFFIIRTTIG
jgi:hypothetical protein